jgi:hypothetical protein
MSERMSASTQGLALNALVFHFKHVIGAPFGDLGEFQRSKRPCSEPSGARRAGQTLRSPSAATRCGTASPPTCSNPARISAPCRNCSGTATSRRR